MAPADNSTEITTAQDWWADIGTKIAGAVLIAVVLGLGTWMASMYGQLITLNFKADQVNQALAEMKENGHQTQQMAADNAREIDRIKATQLTPDDVGRMLAPLDYRLTQLESRRKR